MQERELLSVASEKPKELQFTDIKQGDIFRLKKSTPHREIEERESPFYDKPFHYNGFTFPEGALFAVDYTARGIGYNIGMICIEMGYHWRGADIAIKPDYPNHKYHNIVVGFYKLKDYFEKEEGATP